MIHESMEDTVGPEIVDVEKREEFPTGDLDAPIAGGCRPLVRLSDGADVVREGCSDVGGAIGRAIIDDDEFERLVVLRQDVANGLRQKGLAVVDGHDDGQQRTRVVSSMGGRGHGRFLLGGVAMLAGLDHWFRHPRRSRCSTPTGKNWLSVASLM